MGNFSFGTEKEKSEIDLRLLIYLIISNEKKNPKNCNKITMRIQGLGVIKNPLGTLSGSSILETSLKIGKNSSHFFYN